MAKGEYRESLQKELGGGQDIALWEGGGVAEQGLEGRIGIQWVARRENHS